jgi:sulfonate transport system permease protein
VLLVQGIQRVPQSVLDVPRAYGASAWRSCGWCRSRRRCPISFAATRLTAPRALLGVMIAEWLATGTGLGNLLNQSRGYLDYAMIWTVAAVSVIVAVVAYGLVLAVERRVLRRLGMQGAE